MGKAIGIPSYHTHYDAVADNGYQQAVHSFPVYYSSALDRYLGYANGNNHVFENSKSGSGTDRAFYFNEVPLIIPNWETADSPYPGTNSYLPDNTCAEIVSLERWEEINNNGVTSDTISSCIMRQIQ